MLTVNSEHLSSVEFSFSCQSSFGKSGHKLRLCPRVSGTKMLTADSFGTVSLGVGLLWIILSSCSYQISLDTIWKVMIPCNDVNYCCRAVLTVVSVAVL